MKGREGGKKEGGRKERGECAFVHSSALIKKQTINTVPSVSFR